jgi:hypothetical protein
MPVASCAGCSVTLLIKMKTSTSCKMYAKRKTFGSELNANFEAAHFVPPQAISSHSRCWSLWRTWTTTRPSSGPTHPSSGSRCPFREPTFRQISFRINVYPGIVDKIPPEKYWQKAYDISRCPFPLVNTVNLLDTSIPDQARLTKGANSWQNYKLIASNVQSYLCI